MDKTQADAVKLLTLPDASFFALDDATVSKLESTLANGASPAPLSRPPNSAPERLHELLAIGAPSALDWRQREVFPLLVASVRSGQREWEVQELQNQWTLVSNLGTGGVELRGSLSTGRRMPANTPSKSGTPPSAALGAAGTVGVERIDLLKRFPRDSLQGRLAITLIEFDRRSNTVRVDVAGAAEPPRRRVQRMAAQPILGATGGDAGVSFTAEHSVAQPAPAAVQIPVQVRLQAQVRLPRQQVTAIAAPNAAGDALVLAASVLLLKLDDTAPALLHLTVPAKASAENVEAAFSIDLRAGLAGRKLSGDYLAYLVVGDTVSGPQPVKLSLP